MDSDRRIALPSFYYIVKSQKFPVSDHGKCWFLLFLRKSRNVPSVAWLLERRPCLSQYSLRPSLCDRPQLSERWQTYREFSHIKTDKLSLSHTLKRTLHPFFKKQQQQNLLLPIFFLTQFGILWSDLVVFCSKVDFLRKIDTFHKGWRE